MLRRVLRFVTAAGAVCLMIASILAADRFASAQAARGAVPAGALPAGASDADRFTGMSRSLEPGALRISHRWFEPGARSAWHRHLDGQLLFVEKGRARVQKRGGPLREMNVGDSDYTPPNVDHWHGAAPDQEFYQVAVAFGEATEWLEKVGDAQYEGR